MKKIRSEFYGQHGGGAALPLAQCANPCTHRRAFVMLGGKITTGMIGGNMTDLLTAAELAELQTLDTPTICNALEVVAPERRGYGYTTDPLVCGFPDLPPIVGYARTATVRSLRPSAHSDIAARDLRVAYYEHVSKGSEPKISVIQDMDGTRAGYGAFWGEVNSNIHKALGCLGVITDGCIRDLTAIPDGFQMLAGSIKPSHAYVHVVDFAQQVNVAGMTVGNGDLIHADRHGAVVIPHAVARKVMQAAKQIGDAEGKILDVCRDKNFSFEKLRAVLTAPKDIH